MFVRLHQCTAAWHMSKQARQAAGGTELTGEGHVSGSAFCQCCHNLC